MAERPGDRPRSARMRASMAFADGALRSRRHHPALTLKARCTNANGEVQPAEPNWNGGGFMRNVIESVRLVVA